MSTFSTFYFNYRSNNLHKLNGKILERILEEYDPRKDLNLSSVLEKFLGVFKVENLLSSKIAFIYFPHNDRVNPEGVHSRDPIK